MKRMRLADQIRVGPHWQSGTCGALQESTTSSSPLHSFISSALFPERQESCKVIIER